MSRGVSVGCEILTKTTSGGSTIGMLVYTLKRRSWKSSGHTDRIFRAEGNLKSEDLVLIERIGVEDADVHEPLFKVLSLDYLDARR